MCHNQPLLTNLINDSDLSIHILNAPKYTLKMIKKIK